MEAVDRLQPPDGPEVRHNFVTVRGVRVHVAEAGDDRTPTIILLHGFPQHWYAWREVIAALAVDHHVVAVDLPGFGWSEPAIHGYSTAERARDVLGLMDELGIEEADLVGHDWGAWLAFRVALDAPTRVRRLVSISELHPWPLQRQLIPNVWRMWVTALFEIPGIGAAVQKRRGVISWFLARDAVDRTMWTDRLVDVYAASAARASTARAGQRMHANFVLRDIPRLLLRRDHGRPFDTPTLLMTGDHDRYIPPVLLDVPPGRRGVLRVETVQGGHFVLDENPAAVAAAIRAHLAPVATPQRTHRA